MSSSEKRSLVRFLSIYLISSFVLFALSSSIFYDFSKKHLLEQQRKSLEFEASKLFSTLRKLHQSNSKELYYPNSKFYKTAIYDIDKNYIFGSFEKAPKLKDIDFSNKVYVLQSVEPYYLGAAYILVVKDIDFSSINKLKKNIFLFMFVSGLLFALLGYFLGRLFIAPMRENVQMLNKFIQDTTHELNTPISTILTNIEMMEELQKCKDASVELKRVKIASRTLSYIYDNITYLSLNHNYHKDIQSLNISSFLEERVEYFQVFIDNKHLKLSKDISSDIFKMIDKNDAQRVIDNLLSNAIKYNKLGGFLRISLTDKSLTISNTSDNIPREKLSKIVERFQRANSSEGGFGIGLDIVNSVCKSYDFTLFIDSTENSVKVEILW